MSGSTISFFTFRTYSAPASGSSAVGFNTYLLFDPTWYWYTYAGTTTDQLAIYYANLLILQYLQKPRAYATIQAMVYPVLMNQLPTQVQNAFNLNGADTAVGTQLDVLGQYVGVRRTGLGFTTTITLQDADFLRLIQLAIVHNNAGNSMASIQSQLSQNFSGEIYAFDFYSMAISYLVSTVVGSQNLLQLFITEGLLPRPMGCGLSVIAAPVIDKFFGTRTYLAVASVLATPLNSYASYQSSWLSLTYSDAVSP